LLIYLPPDRITCRTSSFSGLGHVVFTYLRSTASGRRARRSIMAIIRTPHCKKDIQSYTIYTRNREYLHIIRYS